MREPRASFVGMRAILRSAFVMSCLVLAISSGVVHAQPTKAPPPPPEWELLVERELDPAMDTTKIELRQIPIGYRRLKLAVDRGEVEVLDLTIHFKNGGPGPQIWGAGAAQVFKDGQRSGREIVLPGKERTMRWADLRYRAKPGAKPRLAVWASRTDGAGVAAPSPRIPDGARGWVKLGEHELAPTAEIQKLPVGPDAGSFDKLHVIVEHAPFDSIEFAVQYRNGGPGPQHWNPPADKYFTEGARTHVIDLLGKSRTIRWLEVRRKVANQARTKVTVWGNRIGDKDAADPQRLPTKAQVPWDPQGWTLLGERALKDGVQTERVELGANVAAYAKLTVVVDNADVEVVDFAVHFQGGGAGLQTWNARLTDAFKTGQKTFTFEAPADPRAIHWIDLKYKRAAGAPANRLSIFGLKSGTPVATQPAPTTPPMGAGPTQPPPPAPIEPAQPPRAGYVWARGHHEWKSGAYAWVPGHWEVARGGSSWVHAHWELRGTGWVFVPGTWKSATKP